MLVLTRKLQQQIKIGEQITVTILRVKGNNVRVGIQAPREVRVVRGELPKDASGSETAATEAAENVAAPSDVIAVDAPCAAGEAPAPLSAAHLPLRRIRNRHGAAPLKQLIAACATLAK